MTDYSIPLHPVNPWEEEPELLGFGGHNKNHVWNPMSPELEFCEYIVEVTKEVQWSKPEGIHIVETGLGQGFVTRRIIPLLRPPDSYDIYDTDEHFLDMVPMDDLPEVDFTLILGTPRGPQIEMADLVILDSDLKVRHTELHTWIEHGEKGSHLIIHDTPQMHSPAGLSAIIQRSGILGIWTDNLRGGWHGIHP